LKGGKTMLRFNNGQPALNMTFVGFGQGGCRIVDVFASFKKTDETPYYRTFGLNSNRNDFIELKHIPQNNRISLDLNGFGKDPSEAIDLLKYHEPSKMKIEKLIEEIQDENNDLVVFVAGLGGGTGTSTIVKALDVYIEKHVTPAIDKVLNKMLQTPENRQKFDKLNNDHPEKVKYKLKALDTAYRLNLFKKVGIIVTLPVRADGPNTLRQVNKFTDYLWKKALNPLNGIAFITFADNQKFYDEFIEHRDVLKVNNYRDYANLQIAEVFHELNLATNMGGTDVTFDAKDFRKVILEGQGCLNVNRLEKSDKEISSERDMYELLSESFKGSLLHAPIVLQELQDDLLVHQKVHNVGLLSVTNKELTNISSSYLDEVKDTLASNLLLDGSVFTGHVHLDKTHFKAIAYTFYKTHGLPERLSKGLVEELEEYNQRKGAVKFKADRIMVANDDLGSGINLDFLKDVSIEDSLGLGTDFSFLDEGSSDSLGSNDDLDFLRDLDINELKLK
jgi:tubulin-like protein CetZ